MIADALTRLQQAWSFSQDDDIPSALAIIQELRAANPLSPYLLETESDFIRLYPDPDGPTLQEAELCLLRGHEINPRDCGILRELAHHYDAIADDPEKALHYARLLLKEIELYTREMNEIVADASRSQGDASP